MRFASLIAEERGVPFIAPFTGFDGLRRADSRYVFNIKAGYAAELDAMVKQLASVGIARIAAVYLNMMLPPYSSPRPSR